MNKYEFTVALDAKVTAAKKKKLTELIGKVVDLAKGKLGKVEDWGEVNGKVFLHFPLELAAKEIKNLSTKLSQESDIIKYLVVKV